MRARHFLFIEVLFEKALCDCWRHGLRAMWVFACLISFSNSAHSAGSLNGFYTGLPLIDNGDWVYMTEGADATLMGCSGACPRKLMIPERVDG